MNWRWVFRCQLGRRCANVVVTKTDFPGIIVLEYTCAGCGTVYHYDTERGRRWKA